MARKPKAKRAGRPSLSKDARRQVRSIRLPGMLWKRAEAHGEITATLERALTAWLDEYERTLQE